MITRGIVAVLLLGAAVLLCVAGAAWLLRRPAETPPPPAVRSTIVVPAGRSVESMALSREGRWLAYTAESPDGRFRLYVRSTDGRDDHEVNGALGAELPFFSPDGRSLAYFAGDALWRAEVTGAGPPQRICDAPGGAAGGAWTDDRRMVFAPLSGRGLMSVPDAGGEPHAVTRLARNGPDSELAHGWPEPLPGGALLFTVARRGRDPLLEVLSASGARTRLVPAIGQARYASAGRLVYSYLGDLYQVAFDASTLALRGAPARIERGVRTWSGFDELGRSGFALAASGARVWMPSAPEDFDARLVAVRLDGTIANRLGAPAAPYLTPRISPDGGRVAVAVRAGFGTRDLRVLDRAHPEHQIFSIVGGDNQSPAWMPDGRLTFASNRDGLQKIYVASADGASITPLFSTDVSIPRNPASWIRRPPLLAFYEIDPLRGRDVMLYRAGQAIFPVAATRANERSPVLAPDGRQVAYVSDASGRDEVYVVPVDGAVGQPRQISGTGRCGAGVDAGWTDLPARRQRRARREDAVRGQVSHRPRRERRGL